MTDASRRGFIGGLIAGWAGLVAGGIAGKKTVEGRIIVPSDEVAESIERGSSDGQLVIATPEDMNNLGMNGDVWFGIPHDLVCRMSHREHEAWLHHHMEVNRSFGYDSRIYSETWNQPKRGDAP